MIIRPVRVGIGAAEHVHVLEADDSAARFGIRCHSRETCIVRRVGTNTPLQALALLNEPTLVSAAKGWRSE